MTWPGIVSSVIEPTNEITVDIESQLIGDVEISQDIGCEA